MSKAPIWAPYLQSIEYNSRKKTVAIVYEGGEVCEAIEDISHIMIYGETEKPHLNEVAQVVEAGVPVIYHRRNVNQAVWMVPGLRPDTNDLLTKQILARVNEHKRRHITRELLRAKWKSQEWLTGGWPHTLKMGMDVAAMRQVEAMNGAYYWRTYFERLNLRGQTRREDNKVANVLDAISKFVAGIALRYITYHHMSPYHGYLHEPTDYPALVYDLCESTRGYVEEVVLETIQVIGVEHERLLPECVNRLKTWLNEKVYTGATRQIVTNHELIHGSVLSLRSYLMGAAQKLVIPTADQPGGGRPRKLGYKLYGRSAGKSDFWDQARTYARYQVQEQVPSGQSRLY